MLILMSDNVASSRKYEGTSYQGNQELKKYIVESSEDNKEKDLYIQGVYGVPGISGKGCLVGCTVRDYNEFFGVWENDTEAEGLSFAIGIPLCLATLAEEIFEGLRPYQARDWAVKFLNSIPVGANQEVLTNASGVALEAARARAQEISGCAFHKMGLARLKAMIKADGLGDEYSYAPVEAAANKLLQVLSQS